MSARQAGLVRVVLLTAVLMAAATTPGCLNDIFGGEVGACFGPESPQKIIRDDLCKKWVIEIDHVAGHAPSSDAIDLLQERLQELVRKDSITVRVDQRNIEGRATWTSSQLQQLEEETRDEMTGGQTIVTHVLYVDGQLAEDQGEETQALAFARGSNYVVMFDEVITDNTDGQTTVRTTSTQMERAVLVHEFGHVLGLVNNGIEMQSNHEDSDHPRHSNNEDSVMFWAVDSTSFFELDSFLTGDTEPPTHFDANDKADICAAGGFC